MEPGFLVNPYPLVLFVRGYYLIEFVLLPDLTEGYLIVAGGDSLLVGKYPDLEEFHFLVFVLVVFTVVYSCTCAHHLHIPFFDNGQVSHAVLVFQVTLQGDGDDFHVLMGMGPETLSRGHCVVVEYAQHTETHSLRIVVFGKTKSMV